MKAVIKLNKFFQNANTHCHVNEDTQCYAETSQHIYENCIP